MEHSIANPRESTSIDLQSNPILEQSLAMHGVPLAYLTDDPLFLTMVTSSSVVHPQLLPSYQGDGIGGGFLEAIDRSSVAQTANGLNPNTGEPAKRKRGRPRKHGPNGPVLAASRPSGLLSSSGMSNAPKKRGRPLGSSKKQQMGPRGHAELEICLHCIDVKEGEDVFSKISSFSQLGSRSICILSATGVASKVTLFKSPIYGGGMVTHEGWLEILSLSGLFHYPSDQQCLMDGLRVSLVDAKGHILGGRIAGSLLTSSPIQVVVGSFIPGRMELKETNATEVVPALNLVSGGTTNNGNSSSMAAFSVPSGDPPRSPSIQSTAICSNINALDHSAVSWK